MSGVEEQMETVLAPLRELGLQVKHGIGIGAVRRDGTWVIANPETRLERGDILLVHGTTAKVEAFAASAAKRREP